MAISDDDMWDIQCLLVRPAEKRLEKRLDELEAKLERLGRIVSRVSHAVSFKRHCKEVRYLLGDLFGWPDSPAMKKKRAADARSSLSGDGL